MTRRLTRVAGVLCAWAFGVSPAFAQDQRAFLELVVNGLAKGQALMVLRPTDTLVTVDALRRAGFRSIDGRQEQVEADSFVSLSSLSPAVTFVVDERALRLTLTVDPDLLERIVRDLQSAAPVDLEYRHAPSAFVNYSVSGGDTGSYEVFTESTLTTGALLWSTTASSTARGTTRGATNVTIDQRGAIRRWIIGDSFVSGGPLGGDAQIAGINIAREFSLAPYFVRYPTFSLSTALDTQSTVEVYVNGRMISQERVDPGQLDLRNFPLNTGHNQTRVVIRDPFGGTRELGAGYYLATSVLASGLHDYQYSVGWRRSAFGTRSFDYAAPVFVARHRVGLNDSVTLGARVEGDRNLLSGGLHANIRLPIGELELAGASSRVPGVRGNAAHLGYMYAGRGISAGGSVRHSDEGYAVVKAGPRLAGSTDLNLFGGFPVTRGASVTVQHTRVIGSPDAAQERTGLLTSIRIGHGIDAVASATRVITPSSRDIEMSIGMSIAFGGRTVASATAVRTAEGTRSIVDVQRSLAAGPGVGYQFHSESGVQQTVSGAMQYQGPYGRYEFRRDVVGTTQHSTVSASGAVVAVGGHLYASRAIRNSFALVRVPGVTRVRAYASNQEIGKTDRGGNLLVTDLLPYYGNKLRIADGDIPFEYVVSNVQMTLAPPYRGGAVALFPVQRVQQVTGTVVVGAGTPRIPAFGELIVISNGTRLVSPIGRDGEFYFENLPSGRYSAVVSHEKRTCEFTMAVPSSNAPHVALGTIRCE